MPSSSWAAREAAPDAVIDWTAIVGADFAARGGPGDQVDGLVPDWVVRPADVGEAQAAVRTGARLVASGLGAHLDVGGAPRALDVLLRLDRLSRVIDHQAGDMTVTVEAGCPLARLQERLAVAGQWLPLDPPHPDRTTLGGLVAANLSGPLRASQGTARDLLLGLAVVGADGALVRGGGRVVKNVAGYDLPKLHVGALGTVGVLVELTFKVRPRPECEAAVVIACRSAREAAEVALAVRDRLDPFWIEVAGSGGIADGPGDGAAVAVGLGGLAAEVEHGGAQVRAYAEASGRRAVTVDDGAALRARLGQFDVEPAAAVLRAATLPVEVGAVLESAQSAARARGTAVRTLAHAANGVIRIAVLRAGDVTPLVGALRPGLESAGGSLVVQRALPEVKAGLDVWGGAGSGLELMRRIKAAFDPAGALSPGRFVAGI
jgi:glycolate oxidase FAD binding subunit